MTVTPRSLDPRGRRLAVLALVALLAIPLLPAVASASPSTFLPYVAYASVPEPEAVAIGDVTGDGLPDAVVTTAYSGDPAVDFKVAVLAQTGTGSLAAPVFYDTVGTYPSPPDSVGIGDVNGDGLPDVVVGIDDIGVQVFPGLAGGGIGAPSLTSTPDGRLIRLGQLDKDGRLDVAAVGWGTDTVTILSDTGAGLVVAGTYAAQHDGYDDLEIGDVTGDGLADVVVMSGQGLAPNFEVLPQLAGGGLGTAVPYDLGGTELTHGVGIGDITGDGRNEVVVSYGGNKPASNIAVFIGLPSGGLAAPWIRESYDIPEPLDVADLDADGLADVVTVHGGWNAVGVYGSVPGGGLWPEQLVGVPYASHYSTQGLAIGDLTGDGRPDLAIADYNHGLIVLANAGPGPNPTPSPTFTPTPVPTATPVPTPTPTPVPTPTPIPTPTPTPKPVPPSTPQGLAASPNLAAGVGLTWQAPSAAGSSPVTGYRIYRGSAQGSASTFLASVGDVLSFTDTTAVNGTTGWYSVSAVSAAGEGPRSGEVSAVRGTAPTAPRTLAGTAPRPGQIGLTWQAPDSNGGSAVTGYRIYRGTASGQETFLVAVGAGSTAYTDASVGKKVKYWYRITASNVLGEGAVSNEITVTSK